MNDGMTHVNVTVFPDDLTKRMWLKMITFTEHEISKFIMHYIHLNYVLSFIHLSVLNIKLLVYPFHYIISCFTYIVPFYPSLSIPCIPITVKSLSLWLFFNFSLYHLIVCLFFASYLTSLRCVGLANHITVFVSIILNLSFWLIAFITETSHGYQ